jgi:type I restriction enzyme S subunit
LSQWFIRNFVIKYSIGGDQPFISIRTLYAQETTIPSPAEQKKIADLLGSSDNLIAAQFQKVKSLEAHKKGLMQKLFPSTDEKQV